MVVAEVVVVLTPLLPSFDVATVTKPEGTETVR